VLDLAVSALDATQPSDPVLAEISPFALISSGNSEWWLCDYSAPYLCLYQVNTRGEYRALVAALANDAA
jgi:hypothetical protein